MQVQPVLQEMQDLHRQLKSIHFLFHLQILNGMQSACFWAKLYIYAHWHLRKDFLQCQELHSKDNRNIQNMENLHQERQQGLVYKEWKQELLKA